MPDQFLISLPSGGQAAVIMSATAGDLFIAAALLVVVALLLFDQIRNLAHLAAKRGQGKG